MLGAARVVDRLTTLVVAVLIAAQLGAAGLGSYSTAMAIWGVITLMGEAGATMFLIRELAKDRERTSSYVVHLSALSVVVSIVVILVAQLLFRNVGYEPDLETAVSVILLAVLPRTLNNVQEAVFIVHERTEFQALTTLVSNLLYVGMSAYLLAQGYGVVSLLLVYTILQYAVTLVYYGQITAFITRLRWTFQWATARRLIGEVKDFAATSALGALFARPEIVILSLISSPQEVGYYSAAMRVAEIWLFVPTVFLNNVFPHLSRSHHAGDRRFGSIQERATRYILAFTLPLAAGMIATADKIIPALFGDGFGSAEGLLRLLSLSMVFYSLMSVVWRSLAALGRQDLVLRAQLVVVPFRLGGGSGLAAALDALGAAISAPLNSILHFMLLKHWAHREGAPISIARAASRFGVSAAAMGGATWLFGQWLELWLLVPLAALIYTALVLLLRGFSAAELREFRALLAPRRPTSAA